MKRLQINRPETLLKFRHMRANAQAMSSLNQSAKIFALELATVIGALEAGVPDDAIVRIATYSSLETYLVIEPARSADSMQDLFENRFEPRLALV